jgi:RNA polymerase sigma-70 factor, ECF subfamily
LGGLTAEKVAERAARESYGRLLAFLAARSRDVAGAEDALADAFAAALSQWPRDGVPSNPEGWLLTVARRRQADAARKRQTQDAGRAQILLLAEEGSEVEAGAIPDRRLALMFACAHPAIEQGMRTALILQTLLGLTAAEIGAAFLVPAATMGQRLVRAKARVKDAGIPFRVPDADGMAERLDAVLDAIYAAYGRDWDGGERSALGEEAIWLARLVESLLPSEPEAKGLLALMLYIEARRDARRDRSGRFVPLEGQDIARWDVAMVGEAEAKLALANRGGPSGRFQIEAAIQSAHIARLTTGHNNWAAVVALYDALLAMTGSPVVALNRAVALAHTQGEEAAIQALDALGADARMVQYQPYWAARAALCRGLGRTEDADEAYRIAVGLSTDPALRDYLAAQISRRAP